MSAYDKLAEIDARIRAGTTTLVDVLDAMRVYRLEGFTRAQYAAATAVNDTAPEPEPEAESESEPEAPPAPQPEPVKRRRKARR